MEDLEKLVIYKQYVEMTYYMTNIILKFPEKENFALVQDIKQVTYEGLKNIIYAQKEYNKKTRIAYLNQLDANLKILKVINIFLF